MEKFKTICPKHNHWFPIKNPSPPKAFLFSNLSLWVVKGLCQIPLGPSPCPRASKMGLYALWQTFSFGLSFCYVYKFIKWYWKSCSLCWQFFFSFFLQFYYYYYYFFGYVLTMLGVLVMTRKDHKHTSERQHLNWYTAFWLKSKEKSWGICPKWKISYHCRYLGGFVYFNN